MAMTLSPGSATLRSAYVNSSLLCESNFTPTATTAFSSQQLHFTTGCLQSDVVSFPQKSVTPMALAEMRQGRKVCWGGWVWVGGWLAMVAMGNGGEENGWLRAGFWVLGGGGIKEMEDREVTLGSGFV
ncbi:Hypothetical predicted protein [Prunus dulcis]|uniref:Uncharacterized protein n=1 Tax=Prunus dulcis TaxID=3755 RepID=A0A5E4G7E8_PRUDU|nr:Hypothetical predicted protein [Prunus dulcis]